MILKTINGPSKLKLYMSYMKWIQAATFLLSLKLLFYEKSSIECCLFVSLQSTKCRKHTIAFLKGSKLSRLTNSNHLCSPLEFYFSTEMHETEHSACPHVCFPFFLPQDVNPKHRNINMCVGICDKRQIQRCRNTYDVTIKFLVDAKITSFF